MKYLYIVILLLICSACGRPRSLSDRIYDKAEAVSIDANISLKDKANQIYMLRDFTNFEWDSLYYVKASAKANEIDSALEMKYEFYSESSERLIFKKAGKIVYHEDKIVTPESSTMVKFVLAEDGVKIVGFTYKNCQIRIRKMNDESGIYYRTYITEEAPK